MDKNNRNKTTTSGRHQTKSQGDSCEGEAIPYEPGGSVGDHSPHSTAHKCRNSQAVSIPLKHPLTTSEEAREYRLQTCPRPTRSQQVGEWHTPYWGREALAPVSNKFPYYKLHCFEESSVPTRDSDYGQNSQKVETTQTSINWHKDQPNGARPCNGLSFNHKREWIPEACAHVDEPWKHVRCNRLVTEDRTVCDSIYKYPE